MTIDISNIKQGFPGITKAHCEMIYENCVVCLGRQNHSHEGTKFILIEDNKVKYATLVWDEVVNDQLERTYAEQTTATNFGAVGISILVAFNLTDYTIVRQSVIGTGIDYWLGKKDDLLFQDAARLEISGIFNNPSELDIRFNKKIRQTNSSDNTNLPAYVSVIEFSTPIAKFGLKK
jgi:hypothetical protein